MDSKKEENMPKSKKPIPEAFDSIERIQDIWDDHSTLDSWDEMEDVDLQLPPALNAKLEFKKLDHILGFPAEQSAEIEAKAKFENLDSKQCKHLAV